MITVTFCGSGGRLTGFDMRGHSGYAARGSDIVCAAVTSAALMTANTVTDVLHLNAKATDTDGHIRLRVADADAAGAQPLLQGLRLHIRALAAEYPQNIQCQTQMITLSTRRCNNNA